MAASNTKLPISSVPLATLNRWQKEFCPSVRDLSQTMQGLTNNFSVPECYDLAAAWTYLRGFEASNGVTIYLEDFANEITNCNMYGPIMLGKAMMAHANATIKSSAPAPKKIILLKDVSMSQIATWNGKFCLPKKHFADINRLCTGRPFPPTQDSFMSHMQWCYVINSKLTVEEYASHLLSLEDCPSAIALSQDMFDYIDK